ncbi:N-acetylgalactosamine-N, N'-diacetylbacillosaminyl-diphospho-undecaprenol 4-alpha-N-acetylgalactosaminyltransferase [Rhodobacteraceae bacterium THAF1]|uniref:glycosyltransferase family 4 protein n=1 Tax=Palleronia sp. THAF1 TaxID=2587842 RepID=UPI000F3F501C|nr:glycosyltransferase family 4 protein [Palleronia sp. THAF1]QFU10336.1 N-acetylgalactosamine-N,N'-diacetylbacillosaminyl-diphospho-undecaprenol 4-alpha-N-acetylgalactosaminyltransferase [Palleronia sp. THAF1]VDC31454.1 N-acetylgalactosamine-N, N'-diacetylbacillosaminyl-diphospho-undecaprenol 4-alpha-N-acetylgalactosaminyltransferase [Rhodobacteraceae bacterium THAF1]
MSPIVLVQAGLGAGGVEKVIARLATHLESLGYVPTILAINDRPQDAYYAVPDSVKVRSMEAELGLDATNSTARRVAWIRRCIRDARADTVLSFLTKINVQTTLACTGLGVKLVLSERNNFRRQVMNPLWRVLMPFAHYCADHSVMLTKAQRDALPAFASRKASVIYNAVEPMGTAPSATPDGHFVAVGRLVEQKGFDILLRALRIGRDAGADLRLTIYGQGEKLSDLQSLATHLHLEDAVTFAGRTPRPHDWMANPAVFVLSSRYEGFGNVLVEALAAGFAVISTDCDWGPAEIIEPEKSGVLVQPDDPKALADAMLRLYADPNLRATLARNGLDRAGDFSEDRIMSQWMAAIESASSRQRIRERVGKWAA